MVKSDLTYYANIVKLSHPSQQLNALLIFLTILEEKMSELQVIGAGFGRTGTATTKAALEILGFGPCHHMFEGILNLRRYSELEKFFVIK